MIWRLLALFWIIGFAAAGCMNVGPEYRRPDTDIDAPAAYAEAGPAGAQPYVPQHNWWEKFDEPPLNQVVARVLTHNPDIRKAAASVLEYRALIGRTRADQFPTLDFNAQAARQQQSVVNSFTGENVTVKTDSFSLTLPAAFELDLWGRLSRATEAARADLLAAEENRQTLIHSLIAEAASQYFNIQSLEARLQISRQLTRTYRENLELVEARYRQGLSSILDVRQARRSLAQSEAEIPPLVQALGKARQALAVLQGQYPAKTIAPTGAQSRFELPSPIPAGLPAELLNRRPDIRAVEASLKAACARIGVAKANRFPQIRLTGSFGYTSNELQELFEPENELWRLAAGIVQPFFDAGKRKSAQKAAEARYQQQVAQYAKTVLEAFSEVEAALLTRRQQIERYERLEIYLKEAKATLDTALDRYQRGLANYLNVLDAQKARFQAELSLVETRNVIYTNRVSLYRALGGGWGG